MHNLLIVLASFLASAVEMVEAVTIVLAVGVTRGWRSAGWGVAAALGALAVIVAVLGPALAQLPIDTLRLVVGTLLLIFGLQWLRKAILRASGLKALHDEDAIYRAEVAELQAAGAKPGHDWYAFTVAFKGVFLEGLEVAFIVLTFGANAGTSRGWALSAAGPCSRSTSSGSLPPSTMANWKLRPGRSSGSARSMVRSAAWRPARSPSKLSVGSGWLRQRISIWSSPSAVPMGATAGRPARWQAMTSM